MYNLYTYNNFSIVKIYNMSIKLSTPATIVAIAFVCMAVIILLPRDMKVYDEQQDNIVLVPYNLKKRLLVLVLLAFPMLVHTYAINCLVVGNCKLFAYILSGLILLWAGAFALVAFS
jgi:hypothetical protein